MHAKYGTVVGRQEHEEVQLKEPEEEPEELQRKEAVVSLERRRCEEEG
jgi:hypothetical protein